MKYIILNKDQLPSLENQYLSTVKEKVVVIFEGMITQTLQPGDKIEILPQPGETDSETITIAPEIHARPSPPTPDHSHVRLSDVKWWSVRTLRALQGKYQKEHIPWKFETLGDLAARSEEEIRSIKGLGSTSFAEIREILHLHSMWFGMGAQSESSKMKGWRVRKFLKQSVDSLALPDRTILALQSSGISTVADLCKKSRKEVLFAVASEKATQEIENKLAEYKLNLK